MIKKTLILVALLAGAPAALAAPSPTSVTIAAQPTIVTYGSATTLAGKVSPVSTKLTVEGQPCGSNAFKALTQPLNVTSAGDWTMTAIPTVNTAYRAKAKNTTSSTVTVQVRPRVTLAKVAAHRFRTRVTAGQSFAGRVALFQRRSTTGWTTVKSVVLVQIATGPAPTIISGKTFRSGISPGKSVRVLLTQRQVGTCYLPGTSNTIRS